MGMPINNKYKKNTFKCPICDNYLEESSKIYSLNDLLELTKPVVLSEETIEEMKHQSEFTQMFTCKVCNLDIFLPQIVGTPSYYIDLQQQPEGSYYEYEKWDFEEAINDIKTCGSIIEIGCGTGQFLDKVKPYVSEVYGAEYNENAIKITENKGFKVYNVSNGLNNIKEQYDSVLTFHVLEHVADPVDFLQQLSKLVKINGKICISVPDADGPVKYIDPCIMNMPPHHATRWRLRTFQHIANKLGLKIDRVAYEPLLERDKYYYSHYCSRYKFPKNTIAHRIIRRIVSKLLDIHFKVLGTLGIKRTSLLKGQSIYLCMTKLK